ncbi:MAG: glucose-6-phosphate dehydrogenase [Candidatus Woesearchaeota archaeon]
MEPTFVFFGGTGDLFSNKLLPAMYSLVKKGKLDKFKAVAIGRRYDDQSEYKKHLKKRLKDEFAKDYSEKIGDKLIDSFFYVKADFDDPEKFAEVCNFPLTGNYIFYLSTLPRFYHDVVRIIKDFFFTNCRPKNKRIVIEKPFGSDEESSTELESAITENFLPEEIYRVDHYLGKEAVQNILMLRSQNYLLETLLSKEHVKEVRIAMSEKSGAEERASFYDKTGAIKDIVQNHLLQVLSLISIDIPLKELKENGFTEHFFDRVSEKKIEILKSIRLPKKDQIYLGQYASYQKDIGHDSNTETFVSLPLYIDNHRWDGVPFKILTGKKLEDKRFYIEIIFREFNGYNNRLRLEFQPKEEIYFVLNTKKLGSGFDSVPVELSFNYSRDFGITAPEAYENIILGSVKGSKVHYADYDFINFSWKIVDSLIDKIKKDNVPLRKYSDYSICPYKEWVESGDIEDSGFCVD